MRPIREARLKNIKDILLEHKHIDVNSLSKMLSVSSVTIRNDLNELEKSGVLYRLHGKVVLQSELPNKSSDKCIASGFECEFSKEQVYIGELAKTLVSPREWIFLGCGFTCAAVAYALRDIEINVLTNNLLVAAILSKNPATQVILTGGYLSGPSRSFLSGEILEEALQGINVSKAFVGASGVDFQFGFSISNLVERRIFQKIRPISHEFIVVADSTKFGKTSFMSIGDLESADCVISDPGIPQEYIDYFKNHDIEIYTSPLEE